MGKFIPVDPDRWVELVKAAGERDAFVVEIDRLKAEVERLQSIHSIDSIGIEQLKAEVERLTFDPLTYLDDHGEWMPRHIHLAAVERLEVRNAELVPENARLKAEVERLRKAGIAMGMCLPDTDEANAAYRAFENAAKDGKTSV